MYPLGRATYEGTKISGIISQFEMEQLIHEPTYITEKRCFCKDLIFTFQPNMVVKSGVHSFLHRNCDHRIANSVCTIQSQSSLLTSIMGVRYFQKSNVDHIGNTANVFQWKESFQNMNINDVVHIFTRTATSIFNNFIPHEIITCDYRDQFWLMIQ